ncbi:MAG TPA: hypothetical protein VFY12_07630 [Arenimonas sp.]|nr:hypothetical protein [Arenimonas sp.]
MAGSFWLFLCLGLAGSAGPGHFGFRLLAFRHQLDKGYAFSEGTEDGGWNYSGWLMRFGHARFADPALNFFGHSAGVMGWLALLGITGVILLIGLQP